LSEDTLHVYDDRLECFVGTEPVVTLPRHHRRADASTDRACYINYRHVIEWLVRKPGALTNLTYRDRLHPSPTFRATWEVLIRALPASQAARAYLGLLHLAHMRDCETALGARLASLLAAGVVPDLDALKGEFAPPPPAAPTIAIPLPEIASYDRLLSTTIWATRPAEYLDDPNRNPRGSAVADLAQVPALIDHGGPLAATG
jgi:hypothetical protein